MPRPTNNRRPPLPQLRKSPRETPEEFERRNQQFNDFRDYKMRNFPRANLILTEAPLLVTNIVKAPKRSCNQPRSLHRPEIIFTHGSVQPLITTTATGKGVAATATNTFIFNIPVPEGVSATASDTSTATSPLASELNEKEVMKKLQERNHRPLYKPLDFSQFTIQKPRHRQTEKTVDSETEIKATRFHRFRRSLKSLKTRFLRALTSLTCCFRSKSTQAAV